MTRPIRLIVLSFALLILGTSSFNPDAACAASQVNDTPQSAESVEHMMAGLSDEQVRQLLIEELKKAADSDAVAAEQMKGPASVLSRMLRRLSSGQDDSKNQLAALFGFIPNMGPDLYKVFIKL